jgi:hypothetical protein
MAIHPPPSSAANKQGAANKQPAANRPAANSRISNLCNLMRETSLSRPFYYTALLS